MVEVDGEVKCVRVDGGGEVHNEVHSTLRLACMTCSTDSHFQ